jgi:limonene-1,2-epoxide hydrolase
MRKRINMLWPHQVRSRWRIVNWCEDDAKILFEGIDEYDQPDGTTVAMPYMGIYQIKNGRIWRARDYFDMAGYLAMTRGDPNPWLLKVVETMTEKP